MWLNEQNQIFRTGNGQILYQSTRFLQNEQVKGANLLKTSKNRHSVQEKTQSCTEREKPDVSYRKRANPVPIERNQTFRTGKDAILYETGKTRRFIQETGKSCTDRTKSDISYRKWANPVRNGDADWLSNEAEALWHRRWPYAKASGYSAKRCMELSWTPFALPLLPTLFVLNNKTVTFWAKTWPNEAAGTGIWKSFAQKRRRFSNEVPAANKRITKNEKRTQFRKKCD